MITLMKYRNRKIYSPLTKGFITTQQAAELATSNPDGVLILSKETGADVTKEVIYSAIDAITRNLVAHANKEELLDLFIETKQALDKITSSKQELQ